MTVYNGQPVMCSIALQEDPRERLVFESFPGSIGEGYQAKLTAPNVGGTQATSANYNGGYFDSFSLSLKFVAGLLNEANDPHFNAKFIEAFRKISDDKIRGYAIDGLLQRMEEKVRWLQALCFPRGDVDFETTDKIFTRTPGTPPIVLITFGEFLTISGHVTSVTITWKPPFHPVTARPYSAVVALTIMRLGTYNINWYDVAGKSPSYGTVAQETKGEPKQEPEDVVYIQQPQTPLGIAEPEEEPPGEDFIPVDAFGLEELDELEELPPIVYTIDTQTGEITPDI